MQENQWACNMINSLQVHATIFFISLSITCIIYNNYVSFLFNKAPHTFTALALSENTAITHLKLHRCSIGADGMDPLSTCLKNKANLQHLDLSENYQIGSKGLTNLGKLNYLAKKLSIRDAL